jgi:hypothetical protein
MKSCPLYFQKLRRNKRQCPRTGNHYEQIIFRTSSMTPEHDNYRSRILIPIIISFLVSLSAFALGIYRFQSKEVVSQARKRFRSVGTIFSESVSNDGFIFNIDNLFSLK